MHQRARAAALLWQSCQATVRQSAVDGQKEMRPPLAPRRARQGNKRTCGTPRRRTHARLIGRQTRPPPGRAVSRNVADRRVTRAKKAPRAHWVLGSGDPSTQSVKPLNTRPQSRRRPERHRGKPRGSAPAVPLGLAIRPGETCAARTRRELPVRTPCNSTPSQLLNTRPPWRRKRPGPSRRGIEHGSTPWTTPRRLRALGLGGPVPRRDGKS